MNKDAPLDEPVEHAQTEMINIIDSTLQIHLGKITEIKNAIKAYVLDKEKEIRDINRRIEVLRNKRQLLLYGRIINKNEQPKPN